VPWHRVVFETEILVRVFRRHNVKKVVEYGCGVGRHGLLLYKKGFDVLLTDIRDWRVNEAKNLPFKLYNVLEGGFIDYFDAGYAFGLIIIFRLNDIIKVLRNIRENLREKGLFIFDYNYGIYDEPEKIDVRIDGRVYHVYLRKSLYKEYNGSLVYEYRVEVENDRGEIIGVEDTSYPIYSEDKILYAINEAGFEIDEMIYLRWDPFKYSYEYADAYNRDSIIYVLRKS
jgi:SAM-dependent methyltransferase